MNVCYAIVRMDTDKYYFTKWIASLSEARLEAERLCRKEQGKFIILESVAIVKPKKIETPIEWDEAVEGTAERCDCGGSADIHPPMILNR